MKDVRIIKRYQNRKLYDTFQSCYVTLEEIAQIIREGSEIQVIDNKSKNNITYMTQIQLLFDQERKTAGEKDVELLKRVIRSNPGTLTGYIRTLEAKLNGEEVEETTTETVATEGFGTFIQNNTLNTSVETPNTLN